MTSATTEVYYLFSLPNGGTRRVRWQSGTSLTEAQTLLAAACGVNPAAVVPIRDNGQLLAMRPPRRNERCHIES